MEHRIKHAVEMHRSEILEVLEYIRRHPETGYHEEKTSKYLETKFSDLGYCLTLAGDIPGFYTVIDTGRPGPEVMVMAELDALLCPNHPDAEPQTGAAHACGHHAQCAALFGLAAALREEGVLDGLCGKIRLCAVPAEEAGELEFRKALKEKQIISHMGGKREFLARGMFDGVEIAFLVHTLTSDYYTVAGRAVGLVCKRAVYKGVAAHAGSAPDKGHNALYAATFGLTAVNALRETFREDDHIRVHPIITQGGSAINTIPDYVAIETFVRGISFEAITQANNKINRALCAGAVALDTQLEIQDVSGAAPLLDDENLIIAAQEALASVDPDAIFVYDKHSVDTGSTDMGDLSGLIPVVYLYTPGASGKGHSSNYSISDPERACVISAQWQLELLCLLLRNDAKRAREIISAYTPLYKSKEDFFQTAETFDLDAELISRDESGSIIIKSGKGAMRGSKP